jgi:site-specific DNA recombinase
MMKTNPRHKIALYIRVSTEEQASNEEGSIKSQEQRLRNHVAFKNSEGDFGEVVQIYVDRARSGKDTNRPELQRLLSSIKKGEITMVLVTELSRLSRSIKDFCDIWQMMKAHNCEFLSLREQFDTTTAAGEMVLYTVANIAQFERRQVSERVSANLRARAERGLHNGGSIAFGYRLHPEKSGHLVIHSEEAELIREVFETLLQEGSLAAAGRALNERGRRFISSPGAKGNRTRTGTFNVQPMYYLLTNRIYIGMRPIKQKDGTIKYIRAVWDPIVSEETFHAVQALLQKNYRRHKRNLPERFPFLLSGLCQCAQCGDHMPGKSAHGNGGRYSYYEHGWSTTRQACLTKKVFNCNPQRISVKKLEPAVWQDVLAVLSTPSIALGIIKEAESIHRNRLQESGSKRLEDRLAGIDKQIHAVAEHLTKLPADISPEPIFTQMRRLEDVRKSTQAELQAIALSNNVHEIPVPLANYKSYLAGLNRIYLDRPTDRETQTKIIQKLIHKIEVLPDGARIHYYASERQFPSPERGHADQKAIFFESGSKTVDRSGPTMNRTWN